MKISSVFSIRSGGVFRIIRAAPPLFLAAFIVACGSGGTPGAQVVAVVGTKEITTAQLEQSLRSLPLPSAGITPAVQADVVQGLIDQTLLETQAEKLDLDRRPEVVRALDAARRQVLVGFYVDRLIAPHRPSDADISRFYSQNPRLYSARKTYLISDLPVASNADTAKYVADFVRPDASLEDLAARLKNDGVETAVTMASIGSDALPDALADRLDQVSPGTNITFEQNGVRHFARINDVHAAPVPLALAEQEIAERLMQREKLDRARVEIARLRRTTDIKLGKVAQTIMRNSRASAQGQGRAPSEIAIANGKAVVPAGQ